MNWRRDGSSPAIPRRSPLQIGPALSHQTPTLASGAEWGRVLTSWPPPAASILKGLRPSAQRWIAGGKGAAVLRWESVGECPSTLREVAYQPAALPRADRRPLATLSLTPNFSWVPGPCAFRPTVSTVCSDHYRRKARRQGERRKPLKRFPRLPARDTPN